MTYVDVKHMSCTIVHASIEQMGYARFLVTWRTTTKFASLLPPYGPYGEGSDADIYIISYGPYNADCSGVALESRKRGYQKEFLRVDW